MVIKQQDSVSPSLAHDLDTLFKWLCVWK